MAYTVVTGSSGFIGSCLISKLNNSGLKNIVAVDEFAREDKKPNYAQKSITLFINRENFFDWIVQHHEEIDFVFHLGARTDTTEFRKSIFDELNLGYSQKVWTLCAKFQIPLLYASSAATYGLGEFGYEDKHELVTSLKPLNAYGESKNDFDKWVLTQKETPPFWAGMKFFNVFGPNEYHKGRMASVVLHAFNQIKENGKVKLFRSHHTDYKDGMQLRDFIYVKDVIEVLYFMMQNKPKSGLYNLGTGAARTFLDLTKAVFKALDVVEDIEFIDTPIDIRNKYQYFTQANMDKLHTQANYTKNFLPLEDSVYEYVTEYLSGHRYY